MLQSVVQPLVRRVTDKGSKTLIQRAIASLRARGTDAHLWLPGGDVKTYGAELVTGNSSTFDSGTGNVRQNLASTIAAVGGVLRVTQTASNGRAALTVPCTIGRTYSLSISLRSVSGAAAASAGFSVYDNGNTATYTSNASTTFQTITATKTATEANLYVSLGANGGGSSVFEYDNISVREITSITSTITSGLTTGNYLESTGNTLATVDNPTGLVLDALGSVSATELVTNGGFDSATGWTYALAGTSTASISGGVATITKGDSYAFIAQNLLVENKVYECTLDIVSITGTASLKNGAAVAYATFTSAGQKTFRFRHSVVDGNAYLSADSGTVVFDNISVREVSGIHLTQGTTQNKPLLRRGLWNLSVYSQDLTKWQSTAAATITGGQADPLGGTSAQLMSGSGKNVYLTGPNASSVSAGVTITQAIHCYSPTAGTLTIGSPNGGPTSLITISAGWGVYTFSWTSFANDGPSILLTGSLSSLTVYRTALFQGTYTASQIIAAGGIPVTTTAAASNPDAGKYSWAFDGSNDSLALGSVPFVLSDDWAIVASAKIGVSLGWSTIFGASGAGTIPRLQFYVSHSTGYVSLYLRDDAGANATFAGTTDVRNSTIVLSAVKVGSSVVIRVNGVQVNQTTSSLGVVTFTGVGIGMLYGGGDYFAGSIYHCNTIKGAITASELFQAERLAASAAGITI